MPREIEAKFININKEQIIKDLENLGATLIFAERFMKRCTYTIPSENISNVWARVRDEGNGIVTITYKKIHADSVDGVEEVEIRTDDFEKARKLLEKFGLKEKSYQETKRIRYFIEKDKVEFDIDTWPALNPYLEIEAPTKDLVKKYAELLNLDWEDALFGSTDLVYSRVYNINPEFINYRCPKLTFDNIPKELTEKNKR